MWQMKTLFLIFLFSSIFANESKYISFKRDVINYHFEISDSIYIKKLSLETEDRITKLENFFGIHLKNSIDIYYAHSKEKFKELTGDRLPDWSGGVAFTNSRIIVVKPSANSNMQDIIETLVHELVHIFIADFMGNYTIPLWINEGLATYFSKRSINLNDGLIISNAIASNSTISLNEIDRLLNMNSASASLAYLESQTAVEYLINNIDEKKFLKLLSEFKKNPDINLAFTNILGYDLEEFEYHWHNHLEKRFKWMVVLNFENFLWFLLVLIVIIAFIVVKIKNRKKVKNWEKSDEIESFYD